MPNMEVVPPSNSRPDSQCSDREVGPEIKSGHSEKQADSLLAKMDVSDSMNALNVASPDRTEEGPGVQSSSHTLFETVPINTDSMELEDGAGNEAIEATNGDSGHSDTSIESHPQPAVIVGPETMEENTPAEPEVEPSKEEGLVQPRQVKKPRTAYFCFLNEYRNKVKEENPDLSLGPLQKVLAQKWKELSEDEKQHFTNEAAADMERYKREMQEMEEQGLLGALASAGAKKSSTESAGPTFPIARLKRLVKKDEEIKQVSKEGMTWISAATEAFVTVLAGYAAQTAQDHKRRTVQKNDVYKVIHKYSKFDWLRDDFPKSEMTISSNEAVRKSVSKVGGAAQEKLKTKSIGAFFLKN